MNKVIAVLVVLIVAFFVYNSQRHDDPEVGVVAVPATVEERLRQLLSENPVNAERLAALVEEDPRLAARILRDRLLTLDGTIESFRVTSTDRKVLRIRLRGAKKEQVCLTFDLRRYNTTKTTDTSSDTFEVVGHEVLYLTGRAAGHRTTTTLGKPADGHTQVLFRIGERISKRARFDRLGLGEIHFHVE